MPDLMDRQTQRKYDAARLAYLRSGRIGKAPPSWTSMAVESLRFASSDGGYKELCEAANAEAADNPRYGKLADLLELALAAHEQLLDAANNAASSGCRGIDKLAMEKHIEAEQALRRHLTNGPNELLIEFAVAMSRQRGALAMAVATDYRAIQSLRPTAKDALSVGQKVAIKMRAGLMVKKTKKPYKPTSEDGKAAVEKLEEGWSDQKIMRLCQIDPKDFRQYKKRWKDSKET